MEAADLCSNHKYESNNCQVITSAVDTLWYENLSNKTWEAKHAMKYNRKSPETVCYKERFSGVTSRFLNKPWSIYQWMAPKNKLLRKYQSAADRKILWKNKPKQASHLLAYWEMQYSASKYEPSALFFFNKTTRQQAG